MLVAWMLYPHLFSEKDALNSIQEYYDQFTNADVNVNERAYYYTGTAYTPIYRK